MKNFIFLYMVLLVISCFARHKEIQNISESKVDVAQNMSSKEETGWKSLFNSKDFSGWIMFLGNRAKKEAITVDRNKQSVFQVEDGIIHMYKDYPEDSTVPEGFIASEKEYGNYRLKLEFKWGSKKFAQRVNKKRNSGIMFLAQDTVGFWPTSVECQVMEGDVGDVYTQSHAWITTTVDSFTLDTVTKNKIPVYSPKGKDYEHGGEGSKRLNHDARYDKSEGWNTVEIIVKGNEATYIINGKVNNHLWNIRYINPNNPDDKKPLFKGRILLQAEATEIFYRDIMIREE